MSMAVEDIIKDLKNRKIAKPDDRRMSTEEINNILSNIRCRSRSETRPPAPKYRAPFLPEDEGSPPTPFGPINRSRSRNKETRYGPPGHTQKSTNHNTKTGIPKDSHALRNINSDYEKRNSEAELLIRELQDKLLNVNNELNKVDMRNDDDRCDKSVKIPFFAPLKQQDERSTYSKYSSLADEKKEEGNKLYKLKNYRDALSKYSEAIALCSENSALYGNRSACFMMMGLYPKALEDCRRSISLNPEFIKGYVRLIKCSIIIGDILTANQAIEKVEALDPGSNIVLEEKQSLDRLQSFQINSEQAYNTGDFRTSVYYLDQRLLISSADKSLKIRKAECLVYLGRYEEATKLIFDLLRADSMDVDAIYVRGLCLYYNDEIDKALSHFQQVLKFSPDHQKAKDTFKKAKLLKQKKVEGNSAFRTERLASAHAIYSEALEIDPLNKLINSKIYLNRAIVAAKLDRLRESIEDCDRALEITPTYLKALLRRAKSYMDLGECDDAARDYETLAKIEPSNHEYRLLLQNAQIQSKKLKRKDYYKILGVKKNANDDEIKKAYRKRALVHHPDRHSGASEKERVKHEKIFKEVGEAYGVLSDSQKKSRYDNGADLADIDPSESYRTKIDPERIFQAFFTNGAMGGGGHPFTGAGDFNFTF